MANIPYVNELPPQIVLIGDSLTQFSMSVGAYGALLADTYQRRADVIVRGYSGYTTAWMKPRLSLMFPKEAYPTPPLFVTLFLGANDAAVKEHSNQYVPLEDYKEGIQTIIDYLKEATKTDTILLITPPPVDGPRWQRERNSEVPYRDDANAVRYAEAITQIASDQQGVHLVDIRSAILSKTSERDGDHGWSKMFFVDGLHLNPSGNKVLFDAIIATLEQHRPDLLPGSLPLSFPHWLVLSAEADAKLQPQQ